MYTHSSCGSKLDVLAPGQSQPDIAVLCAHFRFLWTHFRCFCSQMYSLCTSLIEGSHSSIWGVLCTHFRSTNSNKQIVIVRVVHKAHRLVIGPPLRLRLSKSKHISAQTLPWHFHLIATSLDFAMGIRRRSWIGRPSVLHIHSLGEELSRLQIVPSS